MLVAAHCAWRIALLVTPSSYLVLMRIDCDECVMQHTAACLDCVVGHLLRDALGPIEVDREQVAALEALADVGLVPHLRLVRRAVGE